MKTIDIYIIRTVAASTLLVMLVLLSLFIFVDFIAELDQVGKGSYSIGNAAHAVLLSVPRRMTELMPVTCLLGVTLGLGVLANGSELTAMRAAGVSIVRIHFAVAKFGIVVVALMFLLTETVAPKSELWAQSIKAETKHRSDTLFSRQGFWTRDGNAFVKVQTVLYRTLLSGLEIYKLRGRKLQSVTYVDFASFNQNEIWVLQNVRRSIVTADGVYTEHLDSEFWRTDLHPDLLDVVSVNPRNLTLLDLAGYVDYLQSNDQDASQYALALWRKLAMPVVIFVMISIAVPFVFGPLRSVAIGQRIVVGTMLGISFHVFDQTTAHLGQVYHIQPWLTALFPAAVFLGITLWLMRSVR